jgi:glycosyltransferase involved in cell wall biosynthesis
LIPAADALIATAWQTAGAVAATAPEGGGFYLIQHFEDWDDAEVVRATWRLPLRKIVIAGWLEEMAVEIGEGERTVKVPNGLDGERFGVDAPSAERAPRVGALISAFKGEEDVVAAFAATRERVPQLSAIGYGVRPRPDLLPDWMDYQQLPSPEALRALYNGCSVFLQASRSEGWGLPATEAMLCGCAVVTYDNGGSREYATDGETALVVDPAAGAVGLAEALTRLCEDGELRLRLAAAGRERAAGFTWERATSSLERVLEGGSADG